MIILRTAKNLLIGSILDLKRTANIVISPSGTQASTALQAPVSGGKANILRNSVVGILLVLLALLVFRLAVVIFSTDLVGPALEGTTITELNYQPVDIEQLQSGRLFGTRLSGTSAASPGQQQALLTTPPAVDQTTLNLRLEGVVTGSTPASGFAIIASNNQTDIYRIDDRLPMGNRVVLNGIYPDRVILENNGTMETLWLYTRQNEQRQIGQNRVQTRGQIDTGSALPASYDPVALVNEYRQKFLASPLSSEFVTLSEIVKISPAYENTRLLGYRVSPGEYGIEFVKLGLKTNDIVTGINGIELAEISNLPRLFEVMSTAADIGLSLSRDGQKIELQLSLSDLPRKMQ